MRSAKFFNWSRYQQPFSKSRTVIVGESALAMPRELTSFGNDVRDLQSRKQVVQFQTRRNRVIVAGDDKRRQPSSMEVDSQQYFLKPSPLERFMNRAVGMLARLGLGPRYLHLLEVPSRRSGKTVATPVNLLEVNGHRYLVGGRGHTAWSKNVLAAGSVTLRRGRRSQRFLAIAVVDDRKPGILKAYLQEYRRTVQRFFALPADSPVEAFTTISNNHPVFELVDL